MTLYRKLYTYHLAAALLLYVCVSDIYLTVNFPMTVDATAMPLIVVRAELTAVSRFCWSFAFVCIATSLYFLPLHPHLLCSHYLPVIFILHCIALVCFLCRFFCLLFMVINVSLFVGMCWSVSICVLCEFCVFVSPFFKAH